MMFLPSRLSPPSGVAPLIHAFMASPATIERGAWTTLAWQVDGATSLSINPGIGPVTGTSITVSPTSMTRYTLSALNGAGEASAEVTVTVAASSPSPDGFFIVPTRDVELPTSHPTIKVDPAGGVHVVFTPQSATEDGLLRPVYYAYCPANCTGATAFTVVPLGDGVDFANLDLDPAGRASPTTPITSRAAPAAHSPTQN